MTPDSPSIILRTRNVREEFQKKQEDFYETAAAELMSLEELDRTGEDHSNSTGWIFGGVSGEKHGTPSRHSATKHLHFNQPEMMHTTCSWLEAASVARKATTMCTYVRVSQQDPNPENQKLKKLPDGTRTFRHIPLGNHQ